VVERFDVETNVRRLADTLWPGSTDARPTIEAGRAV
jgi:hypothetical protein